MSLLSNIHVHVCIVGLPILICYYCNLLSFHKAKGLNCSKAVETLSCNNKSFNQFDC